MAADDVLRNNTERRHSEEIALMLASIVESSDDAIFGKTLEGVILSWNRGAQKLYGYSAGEVIGQHISMLVPPDLSDEVPRLLERLRAGEHIEHFETVRRKKNGEIVHVSLTISPIQNEGGEITGASTIAHDITERKRTEEELRMALAEVERLKNQFLLDNLYLREEILSVHNFGEIIGSGKSLKDVMEKVHQVAPTDTTVLITGETGTGKELMARAIHEGSLRKNRPMVKVNCATLPATLVESELFGHEKGAFTGATSSRIGRFELADGATIFLDELGELPLDLQSKLLRVLQEGEFERLGSSRTNKVNVRVIAATNRDLEAAVKNGTFRDDLYYRLCVFPISVPPLRERREDIPQLVYAFLQRENQRLGKNIGTVPRGTMKALENYSWPGNIRELQSVITRAAILTRGPKLEITEKLSNRSAAAVTGAPGESINRAAVSSTQNQLVTMDDVERRHILDVLEQTRWKVQGKGGAAEILNLKPTTLRSRMEKLGIKKPEG